MKRFAIGVVLVVCALPAFAQLAPPGQGYGLSGAAAPSAQSGTPSRDSRTQAWRLLAGYQFTPSLGVEAAVAEAGRNSLPMAGLSAGGDLRLRSWSIAGTGSLPLSKSWSLLGKVGVGSPRGDLAATSSMPGAFSPMPFGPQARSDTFLGLGLGYSLSRSFGLRLEYESYGGALGLNNARGDNWALSLKYSF